MGPRVLADWPGPCNSAASKGGHDDEPASPTPSLSWGCRHAVRCLDDPFEPDCRGCCRCSEADSATAGDRPGRAHAAAREGEAIDGPERYRRSDCRIRVEP